jgi:hypothetical protein
MKIYASAGAFRDPAQPFLATIGANNISLHFYLQSLRHML